MICTYLWGLERVVLGEVNVQKIDSGSVGRSTGSHDGRHPLVQVVTLGSSASKQEQKHKEE